MNGSIWSSMWGLSDRVLAKVQEKVQRVQEKVQHKVHKVQEKVQQQVHKVQEKVQRKAGLFGKRMQQRLGHVVELASTFQQALYLSLEYAEDVVGSIGSHAERVLAGLTGEDTESAWQREWGEEPEEFPAGPDDRWYHDRGMHREAARRGMSVDEEAAWGYVQRDRELYSALVQCQFSDMPDEVCFARFREAVQADLAAASRQQGPGGSWQMRRCMVREHERRYGLYTQLYAQCAAGNDEELCMAQHQAMLQQQPAPSCGGP